MSKVKIKASKDNNIKSYHLLSIYCVLSVYQISYHSYENLQAGINFSPTSLKKNWNSEVK